MTRTMLANKSGLGIYFGTFIRWGNNHKNGSDYRRMMCLRDITDKAGNYVAEHVWVEVPSGMSSTWLEKGYQVEFVAEPRIYNGEWNSKLSLGNARSFCKFDSDGRKERW